MTPRSIKTNGIGKVTTAHMNLEVTLEDTWKRADRQRAERLKAQTPAYVHPQPPRYAGDDRREKR